MIFGDSGSKRAAHEGNAGGFLREPMNHLLVRGSVYYKSIGI